MKCKNLCVLNEISQAMWPRAGSCCELEFLKSGSSLTGTWVSGHALTCSCPTVREIQGWFNPCQGKCREREHHQGDRQITSEMFPLLLASVLYLQLDVWALLLRVREAVWFCTASESKCFHPAVNYEIHQDVFCILTAFETPKICFPCVGLMTWPVNNFSLIYLLIFFWVNKQIITVFVLMTSSYCWPRCYMK